MRNKKFFTIITSRGCPFQCTFCASRVIWGNTVRLRPLEDIFCELEKLKKIGMEQLWIVDDTFTINAQRVKQICAKIKSLNIEWACNARVDVVTDELLQYLKDSNCLFVKYGIESGNQLILDMMKKMISLKQVRETVRLTKVAGIKTSCSFIIGNIGETEKTVRDTIQFAKELNPDFVEFSMLTPYPGTEAYELAKRNRYLVKDFDEYTNPKFLEPVLSLPDLPSKKIKQFLRRAYLCFYFSPRYLFRLIHNSLFSLYELKRNLRLLKAFCNMAR